MNKEMQALLESELLNDETKRALKEAIDAVKAEAVAQLEIDYAKKLVAEKEKINAAIPAFIAEQVSKEVAELVEDVKKYRTLEVDYAKKLEEFKAEHAAKLEESMKNLVGSVVEAEFTELKQELTEAKKNHFGQKIFEAFRGEFEQFGITEDVKASNAKLLADLEAANKALADSQKVMEEMKRGQVMESLLSNLKGSKREVMRTILENVSTEKLEARYNEVIGSVLEESNKEVAVVVEDNKQTVIVESSKGEDKYAFWDKIIKA